MITQPRTRRQKVPAQAASARNGPFCYPARVPGDVPSYDGFLLQKHWRDTREGLGLELWAESEGRTLHVTVSGQEAVMFVERECSARAGRREPVALRTLAGHAVDALYFRSQRDLVTERERLRSQGIYPCEADIKPVERYLMERFVTGGISVHGTPQERNGILHFRNPRISSSDYKPQLRVLSLDIETDGFDGPLLSLAGATRDDARVFLLGKGPAVHPAHLSFHADEADALRAFLDWVTAQDPDVLVGWNVVDFDMDYLAKLARRLGIPLSLGRGAAQAEVLAPRRSDQPRVARVPGRVVLDGIATLRSATMHFESYALGDVAQELLGRDKAIDKTGDALAEIRRMAREDPIGLARYNLEDCRLVLDIFDQARLLDFAMERQRLTGLPMDRQGGSVAAFDQLYLPRLHRAGYVAKSVGDVDGQLGSPGGYVMDSVPGLYRNVIVLDFKSLYPSIIRTFLVDPLGLAQPGEDPVTGYDGGTFAREGHILPELIRALWVARDAAKRERNAALSQAIKIMMNSFYGVLGTPGCRFFDHRLVSSITRRGHQILADTRCYIEGQGLEVIYGDTDSVFVLLSQKLSTEECEQLGRRLARGLTAHFQAKLLAELRLESHLELQYETHYLRFLMPTMRGSEVGTKKRYAGLTRDSDGNDKLVFKGLEAIRTDWTPLARSLQRELFRRVFSDEPYKPFLRETAAQLFQGQLDDQLVYKKRLMRKLDEYQKNVPPHVQAARQLPQQGRSIEYFITLAGPEPRQTRKSPLDYDHYFERQLAPAADSLLHFLDEEFSTIAGKQMSLFEK